MTDAAHEAPRRRRRLGSVAVQIGLVVIIAALAYGAILNAAQNLARVNA